MAHRDYTVGLVTGVVTGVRRIVRLVRQATGRDIDISITESETTLVIPRKPARAQR